MQKHVLSVLAYVVSTFATQAISHFMINKQHYAMVGHMKPRPIFALGILSMLVQGACLSSLYSVTANAGAGIMAGVVFTWQAGAILVSYIALAEAAKYTVPSVPSWIVVESVAGFVQFTLFGVLLGIIHRGIY